MTKKSKRGQSYTARLLTSFFERQSGESGKELGRDDPELVDPAETQVLDEDMDADEGRTQDINPGDTESDETDRDMATDEEIGNTEDMEMGKTSAQVEETLQGMFN